jgi:hypothetical protein
MFDTPAPELHAIDLEQFTRAELVEWIVACALLVVGLSLLTRPKFWISAFEPAARHPIVPLVSGLYALLAGLVVVSTHNLWVSDVRVVVTVLGWVALGSGIVLLLAPEVYGFLLRRLPITPALVALRGLVRIALGGVVMGYLLTQA